MISHHCHKRIKERKINIDPEMIELLVEKAKKRDVAYILGEVDFLGDRNYLILFVRNGVATTIEPRRKSQTITRHSLDVEEVVPYPCLF